MTQIELKDVSNTAAPGVSFYTPAQKPPAGKAVEDGFVVWNFPILSPLCQYSSQNGFITPWHQAHLGGIISRGPGLSIIEATAVVPEGRITPEDLGIWSDDHIEGLAGIVEFAHSQNQKIGIQLAHAGRKASTVAPWLGDHLATTKVGGWIDEVVGPSAIAWDANHATPKKLTTIQVEVIVQAFASAAIRTVKAGIDVIEIHSAHGYLGHSFLSPFSNKRTDRYGGSFENRTRFTVEVVDAIRAVIPKTMPLFVRVSACDLITQSLPDEPSWRIEDTVRLAHLLAEHGVDFLDISSGGNASAQSPEGFNISGYQVHFSELVKKSVGDKMLVGSVGGINSGKLANKILEDGQADAVLCGRWFQKNPGLVCAYAEELGVKVLMAHQVGLAFQSRGLRRNALYPTFEKE